MTFSAISKHNLDATVLLLLNSKVVYQIQAQCNFCLLNITFKKQNIALLWLVELIPAIENHVV